MNHQDLRDALAEDRELASTQKAIGCLAVPIAAIAGGVIGGWTGFIVFLLLVGAACKGWEMLIRSQWDAKRKRAAAKATGTPQDSTRSAPGDQPIAGQAHADVSNPNNWSYPVSPGFNEKPPAE